jgi:hypothetical protein
MNIIAQGAQYKVVDTHDGRVRKIPLTALESRAVVESWYAPGEAPAEELAINYPELAIDSCRKVSELLHKYPELEYSFGNPDFEGEGTYTQDKAQTLGEALIEGSHSENRGLIDTYVDLILLHWKYGFSERVFNCTVNNGVDKAGRIVLLDFGEVTLDKQKVSSSIASKRWLQARSYKRDIPEQLKGYYDEVLTERLSLEALAKTWGVALG